MRILNQQKWLGIVILGLIASGAAASVDRVLLLNGGFETNERDQPDIPANWNQDGIGPIYKLDTKTVYRGRHSMHIAFKDGMNQEGYAGTIQTIDISRFAGKRLMLSAQLRRTSEKSKVGIWASVVGADKEKLSYQNSYEQPIPSNQRWSKHSLMIDLPKNAATLKVGAAIYENDGEMWVDDIRVAVSNRSP
jgi:hypothetical protein